MEQHSADTMPSEEHLRRLLPFHPELAWAICDKTKELNIDAAHRVNTNIATDDKQHLRTESSLDTTRLIASSSPQPPATQLAQMTSHSPEAPDVTTSVDQDTHQRLFALRGSTPLQYPIEVDLDQEGGAPAEDISWGDSTTLVDEASTCFEDATPSNDNPFDVYDTIIVTGCANKHGASIDSVDYSGVKCEEELLFTKVIKLPRVRRRHHSVTSLVRSC